MEEKLKMIISYYIKVNGLNLSFFSKAAKIRSGILWSFLNNRQGITLKTYDKIVKLLKEYPINYPPSIDTTGILS